MQLEQLLMVGTKRWLVLRDTVAARIAAHRSSGAPSADEAPASTHVILETIGAKRHKVERQLGDQRPKAARSQTTPRAPAETAERTPRRDNRNLSRRFCSSIVDGHKCSESQGECGPDRASRASTRQRVKGQGIRTSPKTAQAALVRDPRGRERRGRYAAGHHRSAHMQPHLTQGFQKPSARGFVRRLYGHAANTSWTRRGGENSVAHR